MVTEPTGKQKGRPPKAGPRRPAHRPSLNFWRDPDRHLSAYYMALVRRGRSHRRALILVALAKKAMKERSRITLEVLTPEEFRTENERRKGKTAIIEGRRLRWKPIESHMLLRDRTHMTTDGVASGIRKKLRLAQRDPAVADWLSAMANQFAILDAMPASPAAAWFERLEQIVRVTGPELEAHLKGVYARINA
jgi:hypothetical protein